MLISIAVIIIFLPSKEPSNEPKNEPYNEPSKEDSTDSDSEITPSDYEFCLIFLHGLNDEPETFQKYFEKINFLSKNKTKLVFLKAPIMNVTYKNMTHVTSWFNIYSLPLNSPEKYNFEDVKINKEIIVKEIEKEVKNFDGDYTKIFLGGHSQGACMTLYTGFTVDYNLGGLISLCGVLFPQTEIKENKSEMKVFLNHGGKDKQIPISFHNETVKEIIKYKNVEESYFPEENHFINKNHPQVEKALEDFLNRTIV